MTEFGDVYTLYVDTYAVNHVNFSSNCSGPAAKYHSTNTSDVCIIVLLMMHVLL